MKRVPNQDVTMQLVPGTNPGESDVVIDLKRGDKPWTVGLSIDDSGTESTGRLQAAANIALYNPTGLNDIMSYSYTKDAEGNDSAYGTKNYYFLIRFHIRTILSVSVNIVTAFIKPFPVLCHSCRAVRQMEWKSVCRSFYTVTGPVRRRDNSSLSNVNATALSMIRK